MPPVPFQRSLKPGPLPGFLFAGLSGGNALLRPPSPTRGAGTARQAVLAAHYGKIANARAGKPKPFFTLGQVTTISAPFGGTLSRFAMISI